MAAALKRSDSKPLQETPKRSCIACTETDIELVRPCRNCNEDFCVECLVDMFTGATADNERFPPHCCHMIQIHTIINCLTAEQAQAYRAKFEEWITPVKTYCPSPTCSAFISEQRVPTPSNRAVTASQTPTLISVLSEVIANVIKDPQARFFRGEQNIELLPGYTRVVERPMDLSMIQDQLSMSLYKSTAELTKDMTLIVSNAKEYNGPVHPVVTAADELFAKYLTEISCATDRLIGVAATPAVPTIFSCAKCHIAICTSCKQIEHAGSPCDTSATDHEIAMLEHFGYKRCPSCKAGVKKMFGCSHMRCVCGAHWCYYCQRSINECDGGCDAYDEDEDEDEYDSELDDYVPVANEAPVPGVQPVSHPTQPSTIPATPATPLAPNDNAIVNLDAGGGRRWAETGLYDFGDEPEEQPFSQVWSCKHDFKEFEAPPYDGFDYGDLDRMECNRCFVKVETPFIPSTGKTPRKRRLLSQRERKEAASQTEIARKPVPPEKQAWECVRCRVLVCVGCRDKYKAGSGR